MRPVGPRSVIRRHVDGQVALGRSARDRPRGGRTGAQASAPSRAGVGAIGAGPGSSTGIMPSSRADQVEGVHHPARGVPAVPPEPSMTAASAAAAGHGRPGPEAAASEPASPVRPRPDRHEPVGPQHVADRISRRPPPWSSWAVVTRTTVQGSRENSRSQSRPARVDHLAPARAVAPRSTARSSSSARSCHRLVPVGAGAAASRAAAGAVPARGRRRGPRLRGAQTAASGTAPRTGPAAGRSTEPATSSRDRSPSCAGGEPRLGRLERGHRQRQRRASPPRRARPRGHQHGGQRGQRPRPPRAIPACSAASPSGPGPAGRGTGTGPVPNVPR